MAVEVYGNGGEVNGYGDSMDAFRAAEEQNARILLNLIDMAEDRAAGRPVRKKNAPRPTYDPRHADNQWPVMLYHATHGHKEVGQNLKGLTGIVRQDVESRNRSEAESMLESGWRTEAYRKPQVAVLDPAAEKEALLARNKELEGKIVSLNDQFTKLMERLDSIEKTEQPKGRK